jgi:chromate transporter
MSEPALPAAGAPGVGQIFRAFLRIALMSFGGGLALWMQREIVERRRWLSAEEFLAGLALARVLPGANQVNLATHVGTRLAGGRGALAAVAGLTAVPFAILVALGEAYFRFHEVPSLRAALHGAVATATGMALAMGIKLARPYATRLDAIAFAAAAFVGVHVLRWPVPWVVLILAPLAIAWHRPRAGGGSGGGPAVADDAHDARVGTTT